LENVVDVKYARDYFPKGQLKSEGWLVCENPSPESDIVKVENYDNYPLLEYKYGVWKRYYKSGNIAGIDSMGNLPNSASHQYDYNEQGCLTKIVFVKEKDSIKIETGMFSEYSLSNTERITFKYYDCDGILKEESFSPENVKNGTWKWYKNGKLFKTKEYKDGKLLKAKKYDT
jgi:antitoxin component YwqK of YwqJK toxin-antitoxin module